MMAAVAAAGNGHETELFEKNEKLGKKLFITGKSNCSTGSAWRPRPSGAEEYSRSLTIPRM